MGHQRIITQNLYLIKFGGSILRADQVVSERGRDGFFFIASLPSGAIDCNNIVTFLGIRATLRSWETRRE
jgi:hypothetical protein